MSDPVQSDNKHVVVALGELLWDMLPSGQAAPLLIFVTMR